MKRNSRFALALHLLGHMARQPEKRLSSEELALFHGTNPVVVRRTLGLLKESNIVSSERGPTGGWRLDADPAALSLAAIYNALGEQFFRPDTEAQLNPPKCAIERSIGHTMNEALEAAEAVLVSRLQKVTVADLEGETLVPS